MQSRPSRIDVALARAFLLQVIARADAGQAGADDQDVEMFCWHRSWLSPLGHGRANGAKRVVAPIPAILVLTADCKDVDARHKAGHDES